MQAEPQSRAEHLTRATLTVEETAKVLGVGRNQVYAAIHQGDIPAIRLGRRFLIPIARLEEKLGIKI